MRKFLLLVGLVVALASCEKQDDNFDLESLDTTKEITWNFNADNLSKPSKTAKFTAGNSQAEILATYIAGRDALLGLQAQTPFFNNGVIVNAVNYMNNRITKLENLDFTKDGLQAIVNNLHYIVAIVDEQVATYRATLGNYELAAPVIEKQADEAPFRMFETVPVNMNGTVVTLEGIEIVSIVDKYGNDIIRFNVFGENVDLLPEGKVVMVKDNSIITDYSVAPNSNIVALDLDAYTSVQVDILFVGVAQQFIIK